ncbi:MAG: amidase family protein [Gammaproteobacteria bacterium]|nr:amidase family protein [Gammaproteobacteria bacterium]
MEAGESGAVELAAHFIERIEALDGDYHAVIMVNPEALQQAAALDGKKLAKGRVRGPLHGIPVLIKDNIETREMPTTAGSLALGRTTRQGVTRPS